MRFAYPALGLTFLSDVGLPRLEAHAASETEAEDPVELLIGRLPAVAEPDNEQGWERRRASARRDGTGRPLVVVDHCRHARLFRYRYADGTTFAIAGAGDRVWMAWREPLDLADATTYLFGPILGFLLRRRDVVALHASCVVIDGRAVALAGPAGAGKSTTAAAFAALGFAVLSDDITALRPVSGKPRGSGFEVLPDAPIVRLWPASAALVFGRETTLPRISGTWDKRYLALGAGRLPAAREARRLAAVYLLERSAEPSRAPAAAPLSPRDALIRLVARSYGSLNLEPEQRAAELEVFARLLGSVTVKALHRGGRRPADLARFVADDFRARRPLAAAG